MTAFNDIIEAEKQAEEAINKASSEVNENVEKAKQEKEDAIQAEVERLRDIEKEALVAQEKNIAEKISKLESEAASKSALIESKFSDHQAEAVKLIKDNLSS